MKTSSALVCSALCMAASSAACGVYRPPYTQASQASPPADSHQATLVFLWPTTSCDPGGYYVIAAEDGRFLGTISSGTQLRSVVAPGPLSIVGWNELQERAGNAVTPAAVSVLHGSVLAGQTYYVQLKFGEWDEQGPREQYTARIGQPGWRSCIAPDHSMTTAMVRLTPASEAWKELPQWTTQLDGLAPDRGAGQAWLDENRETLRYHRVVAEARFAKLRPGARRLATLDIDDGTSGAP